MNGWTNYETWNVALWLQNDESLYRTMQRCETYEMLLEYLDDETGDGVRWDDPLVNRSEITDMMISHQNDSYPIQ